MRSYDRNLSAMISIIKDNYGVLMKLANNFTCILPKIKKFPFPFDLDEMSLKLLFSNFTRHHLITDTHSSHRVDKK